MGVPCILTDGAVQFTHSQFQGKHLVQVLPLDITFKGRLFSGGKEFKPAEMPHSCRDEDHPGLLIPSTEELSSLFLDLSQKHSEILCIFHASSLSPLFERATVAAEAVKGRTHLVLIDSQTISGGQGLIVQATAELFNRGLPASEVEREARIIVNHTFSIFCIPGMSYLHAIGFLDPGQAGAGELLGLMPIFAMEEGHLTPLEKLRSQRQTIDFFQEYLDEFDHVRQIVWVKGTSASSHDSRLLHDHAMTNFPQVPFTELAIHPQLAILFGSHATGFFILEAQR